MVLPADKRLVLHSAALRPAPAGFSVFGEGDGGYGVQAEVPEPAHEPEVLIIEFDMAKDVACHNPSGGGRDMLAC